jgi:hypothetical protein
VIEEGTIVHSTDPRDDRETYYVVLEADIPTSVGLCCRIAEVGREEWRVYRRTTLLKDATAEIHAHVDAAKAEATKLDPSPWAVSWQQRALHAEAQLEAAYQKGIKHGKQLALQDGLEVTAAEMEGDEQYAADEDPVPWVQEPHEEDVP